MDLIQFLHLLVHGFGILSKSFQNLLASYVCFNLFHGRFNVFLHLLAFLGEAFGFSQEFSHFRRINFLLILDG